MLVRCERLLGLVLMPPEGTQHHSMDVKTIRDFPVACGCIQKTKRTRDSTDNKLAATMCTVAQPWSGGSFEVRIIFMITWYFVLGAVSPTPVLESRLPGMQQCQRIVLESVINSSRVLL